MGHGPRSKIWRQRFLDAIIQNPGLTAQELVEHIDVKKHGVNSFEIASMGRQLEYLGLVKTEKDSKTRLFRYYPTEEATK